VSLLRTRIPLKVLFGYRFRYLLRLIGNGFRSRTILFYPGYPSHKTLIFKICRTRGYNITTDLHRSCDLAFAWENTTWRPEYPELRDTAAHVRVLNRECRDISKSHLADVFAQVFGYPLALDPTVHEGKCVEKADRNATKSGQVVTCPLPAPEPECCYQRLINNVTEEGLLEELRIPVIGGRIPLLFFKHKPQENRFFSGWLTVAVREPDDLLTDVEQEQIGEFCRRFGLDWGEIDVLRDFDDGRIYIVDANNTPWGPSRDLPESERRALVRRLAQVFEETFLE